MIWSDIVFMKKMKHESRNEFRQKNLGQINFKDFLDSGRNNGKNTRSMHKG